MSRTSLAVSMGPNTPLASGSAKAVGSFPNQASFPGPTSLPSPTTLSSHPSSPRPTSPRPTSSRPSSPMPGCNDLISVERVNSFEPFQSNPNNNLNNKIRGGKPPILSVAEFKKNWKETTRKFKNLKLCTCGVM